MLATILDTGIPLIPSAWHSAVLEIQTSAGAAPSYPNHLINNGYGYQIGNALSLQRLTSDHTVKSLGWSAAETLETHLRLRSFAEDWSFPGMEVYDDL